MPRRTWLHRWAMVWAVLQFALPTAAAFADARLEIQSSTQVAHVEAHSASTCQPQHTAECALCQVLSHHPGLPEPGAPPAILARLRSPASTRLVAAVAQTPGQSPPARAPPTA